MENLVVYGDALRTGALKNDPENQEMIILISSTIPHHYYRVVFPVCVAPILSFLIWPSNPVCANKGLNKTILWGEGHTLFFQGNTETK